MSIYLIEGFLSAELINELPEELFETGNGDTEDNNSKPSELQQFLENEAPNSNLSSNKIHQTANPVAMTGKDLSNPSSPAINNNTNSVPSPSLNNNAMVSPVQITTSSTTRASPQPSAPNLSAAANMNSQHHPTSGPLHPMAPTNSHAMTTNAVPLTSMPQNFYNAASPQGLVNPAMLPSRMRNGPIPNQNSGPMHNYGRQMTTEQANHMNTVNSLANNSMATIKAEPNYMMGQPGMPMNQGGMPSNQGGMALNQGGMAVNQGGMTVNQGGMALGDVSNLYQSNLFYIKLSNQS